MERTLKSIEEPILRDWELNSTSTRWDYLAAAPSDEAIMNTWIALSATTTFVVLVVGTIMTAILIKPKMRRTAFNLYLVGLMTPDFIFSLICGTICYLNLSAGHYYSASVCKAQTFFETFGIAGNSWMTVVILRQLLLLLTSAKQCRRYKTPSRRIVVKQCVAAYAWAAFVGTWSLLPRSWGIPHRPLSNSGYACFALDYDLPSSLLFFLLYIPAIQGIPMVYTLYVFFKIWKDKLMPQRGQRKLIAAYLLRIVICMFVWWVPSIFNLYIYPNIPREAKIFFSVWMHFQGAVSALLMLSKPDIKKATQELLLCHACRESCRIRCCCCSNGNGDPALSDTSNQEGHANSGADVIPVSIKNETSVTATADSAKLAEDGNASITLDNNATPAQIGSEKGEIANSDPRKKKTMLGRLASDVHRLQRSIASALDDNSNNDYDDEGDNAFGWDDYESDDENFEDGNASITLDDNTTPAQINLEEGGIAKQ